MARKDHITISSVEGTLGYPPPERPRRPRKPPPKRSRRERVKTRSMKLARKLKGWP